MQHENCIQKCTDKPNIIVHWFWDSCKQFEIFNTKVQVSLKMINGLYHSFNLSISWKLTRYSLNHKGYIKNWWINTRIVCAHSIPFFMANPNLTIQLFKLFCKIETKSWTFDLCSLTSVWRVLNSWDAAGSWLLI